LHHPVLIPLGFLNDLQPAELLTGNVDEFRHQSSTPARVSINSTILALCFGQAIN
jgi:hypothetical protein